MTIPGYVRKRKQSTIGIVVLLFVLPAGCSLSGFRDGMDTVIGPDDPNAISHVSSNHNGKGLHYLSKGKFGKAETHFHKALNSDPRSAAAHNNIGNMMLSRHELYQAAWEFQRASELAPGAIEPIINLGLVHEEGERLDEAVNYYRRAIEMEPNNAIAVGNLARVLVKLDADSLEIHGLLKHLIFVDSRCEWLEWAEELIATRYSLTGRPRGQFQAQSTDGSYQPQTPHGESLIMPEAIPWSPELNSPPGVNPGSNYWPSSNEPIDNLPAPLQPNPLPPSINALRPREGADVPSASQGYGSLFPLENVAIPMRNFQVVAPAAPISLSSNSFPGARP